MLNGIDPVIIVNLRVIPQSLKGVLEKIPVSAGIIGAVDLPAIPIYLNEELSGLYIQAEDKNIEIDTKTDTLSSGADANTEQGGLQNSVKITLEGNRDSPAIPLLAAMMDLIYNKSTSKEYSITYLHGSVTVFGGLLNSFSITQGVDDTRQRVSIELIKPASTVKKATVPMVENTTGTLPLN